MPDEIDLSPEDEKALDAAWGQIAREDREAAAAQSGRCQRRQGQEDRSKVRGAAPVRPRLLPLGEPVDEEV